MREGIFVCSVHCCIPSTWIINICWMKSKRLSPASAPSPATSKLTGNQGPSFSNPSISSAETLSSCMDHHDSQGTPSSYSPHNNYPQTCYYLCVLADPYTCRPSVPALYPRMPPALASPKLTLSQFFPQPSSQIVLFPSWCPVFSIWSAIINWCWNNYYTLACVTKCLPIHIISVPTWKHPMMENPPLS